MHLLSVTPGSVSDGTEAVDLDQSPGDILFLTVADSDLTCFAAAASRLTATPGAPRVRIANLLQLRHPYSVDLYVEKLVSHARFVCVVLLGGKSYWPYGVDEIATVAREKGIAFAALADGREEDPELSRASTLPDAICRKLRAYLRQGGPANALGFLRTATRLIGQDCGEPGDPVPVADAGLYRQGHERPTLAQIKTDWVAGQPVAMLVFYRALLISGTLDAVDAMTDMLRQRGLNVVAIYVRSLREPFARDWLAATLPEIAPDILLNATSFAASSTGEPRTPSILESADCPILQTLFAGVDEQAWRTGTRGLAPRDLAMNVALPEVDGRLFTRAVAFKGAARFDPVTECGLVAPHILPDRMAFVADLAANWATLRRTPVPDRRVALIMANYPNRDGRIGNGVGLDTPASTASILSILRRHGYATGDAPTDGPALMRRILAGVTNDQSSPKRSVHATTLPFPAYRSAFAALAPEAQAAVTARWGRPEDDPFADAAGFRLAVHRFGNILVAVQPARGYDIDPKNSYHSPDLPPPHHYLAFHFWLNRVFRAQAVVHVGKHGNLEWLPGKAVSLSAGCFPEIASGPVPALYPFIVNDPGEGTQAKRRISACILDHLTPPLTRAESYGPLKQLETLVDEYYLAAGMDPRRLERLRRDILDLARSQGLDQDAGADGSDENTLAAIDNYLCELKEMQIRDGLHIFAQSPDGTLRRDLLAALTRTPRGYDRPGQASLPRALAQDLELGFDPLDCRLGDPWTGPRPAILAALSHDPWRTHGDTVERLENLVTALIDGAPAPGPASAAVMETLVTDLGPRIDQCGKAEETALLAGLDGRFVPPGPSGAPTRGRPDVLPTGRNFYSVDTRAVPTAVAWGLGRKSADMLIEDYLQREGDYPRAMAISAWGTANMRTGGDDIAQALALMGVRPKWDWSSGHVTGFDILSLAELGRPRVDVTFRVSGFFRDAFPDQIDLLDSAARAVMALEETAEDNPAAARHRAETAALIDRGIPAKTANRRAGARVFGSRPGAYGAGLQAMIDEKIWHDRADLAAVYLDWGGYAYGSGTDGAPERDLFAARLAQTDALIQNQDNREHDLLDSDDYYQFEGGIAAAVEHLAGKTPLSYHNDHSRPEKPAIRTLSDEIGRVVRARVTNPKWIAGVMRHDYKGAFEIAASVDYLFAFAATTNAVKNHHFDAVHAAFIEDETVLAFMRKANPAALRETAQRLSEAIERGLWKPKSNSAGITLARLMEKDAP